MRKTTTPDNRKLRQQRSDVLKEARALSAKGPRLNPADQKRFDDLMAEGDELRVQYEAMESRGMAPIRGGTVTGNGETRAETSKEVQHREAFTGYLRHGIRGIAEEQRSLLQAEFRDMGSGGQGAYPGATSGFFVPVGFVQNIVEALKYYGPLLDDAVVELMDTATGQVLPYPTDNDINVVGERVGEGQQVSSADVSLGQILFGSYKYSSKLVKVSIELLQDSAFDLEAFLIRAFSRRLGRALVADFTNGLGSGSSQPTGIVTSTLQNGTLVAATGSSSNDGTAAGANSIGSDDLVNLEHSIDVLYRPGASYMAHDSTWKAIRKIKDKYGRPLWEPSLVAGQPATINGYPMLTNNFMDTLEVDPSSPPVTVNSVLFGNMKRFLVRRVKEMSVLRLEERFADYGQVAFLAFARYDSSPLFAGTGTAYPFALLQNTF